MDNIRFEKGRIISFIDAVFSIAMTLLVLEISIPAGKAVVDSGTWSVLADLIPNFVGLIVSFLVTALYWVAHLRIMKYVSDFDNKLLWLNIFLLLFIVLLPFSTGFYVSGFALTGPFVFYSINLAAIGLFDYLIVRYVIKKEGQSTGLTPIVGRWQKARALNSMLVWALAAGLAFGWPMIARFTFLLIFVFQLFINRHFKKKSKLTVDHIEE